MRIAIDKNRCGGLGLCTSLAPDVFSLGEDGLASADETVITGDIEDDVRDAVATCPSQALAMQ